MNNVTKNNIKRPNGGCNAAEPMLLSYNFGRCDIIVGTVRGRAVL